MKRILTSSVVFLFLLMTAAAAQTLSYIITGGGNVFTATDNNGDPVSDAEDVSVQNVIDAISADAGGKACSIQFGDGIVDMVVETGTIVFDGAAGWGHITLLGRLNSSAGVDITIRLENDVSLESWAAVSNLSSSANAITFYNYFGGTLTVRGGEISSNSGKTVQNVGGVVEISGGLVINKTALGGEHYAVYNAEAGKLIITGGNITASDAGCAVVNESNSSEGAAVTISGGKVTSNKGYAVYNNSAGKIDISGTSTEIASANSGNYGGTVYNAAGGTIDISGGQVINSSSSGNAFFNVSTGDVIISDGQVSTVGGHSIRNNSTGTVTISGGTVSAISGNVVYNASAGVVTVSGGSVFVSGAGNALYNSFTGAVTVSGGMVSATNGCAVYNNSSAQIFITDEALIFSENSNPAEGTVYNNADGSITVSGGEVANMFSSGGNAVYNRSAGTVTISDSAAVAVIGAGNAVNNNNGGTVNISGGSVSAVAGRAVLNGNNGILTISGGEVSATTGTAVYNSSGEDLTVSGGKVIATATGASGIAINHNSGGKVIISGDAQISSANTNLFSWGTIYIEAGTVEITGGKVLNTAADRNAIYCDGSLGSLVIGGAPEIDGRIAGFQAGKMSLLSGEDAFIPGDGKYTLSTTDIPDGISKSLSDGDIAVVNGAQFTENFTFSGSSLVLREQENDLVARTARTVTFNLNGGEGTPPQSVIAAFGEVLFMAQKPAADGFTRTGYINDGNWYTRTGSAPNHTYTEFKFGEDGAPVTANITLYLKWTAAGIVINTDSLSAGVYNGVYSALIEVSVAQDAGGTFEFTVSAGNLPDGLELDSFTGEISGTAQKVGSFTFTVKAQSAVSGASDEKEFTVVIGKARGIEVSTPTLDRKTDSTITVRAVTLPNNGQSVEYAISETNTPPVGGWQTDVTFTELTAGAAYYIFARSAENDNYTAGAVSGALAETAVYVMSRDRVIPPTGPNADVEFVAPLVISAGEFTAGPNPVAKSTGIVNFYRQGKSVSSGTFTIYDASGNFVNKIRITDKVVISPISNLRGTNNYSLLPVRRAVGSWDLKDSKGRSVSEGTYLVKGTVKTADGRREKVSLILGIR
ncbi:MAG: putative Ig domain-containing protein [Chitinispirillales bacterium]|jgi:hypothetical protein|nr:putative Ig domain-containing protein [Chitinispirillales bacterium]